MKTATGDLYYNAELALIRSMGRRLQVGLGSPTYEQQQRQQATLFAQEVSQRLGRVRARRTRDLSRSLQQSYRAGVKRAVKVTKGTKPTRDVQSVAVPIHDVLDANDAAAEDSAEGLYNDFVDRAGQNVNGVWTDIGLSVLGGLLLDQADSGLLSTADGQNLAVEADRWEMLGLRDADIMGSLDTMQTNGYDLCIVSNNGSDCALCSRWEQIVLSAFGFTDGYPTLEEAQDAGLFHPYCMHTLDPVDTDEEGNLVDAIPQDIQDEQLDFIKEQRAVERQIRAWEKRQAASLVPSDIQTASDRIRYYNQRLREVQDHVQTVSFNVPANEQSSKEFRDAILNQAGNVPFTENQIDDFLLSAQEGYANLVTHEGMDRLQGTIVIHPNSIELRIEVPSDMAQFFQGAELSDGLAEHGRGTALMTMLSDVSSVQREDGQWELRILKVAEGVPEDAISIGRAHGVDAIRQFEQLGLVENSDAFELRAVYMSEDELNSIARTVTNLESHWEGNGRLNFVDFVPRGDDIPGYGIDSHNASGGLIPGVGSYIAIGEDVAGDHSVEVLQDALDRARALGVSASHIASIERTLADVLNGQRIQGTLLHTVYSYPDVMEGVVSHEMGHVLERLNPEPFNEVLNTRFHGDKVVAALEAGVDLSVRAMDNWDECIAESYAWYVRGQDVQRIDPDLLRIFRELTDYGY